MMLFHTLPIVAAVGLAVTAIAIATQPSGTRIRNIWIFPAICMCLFLGWSLFAAVSEGPTGFWPEHIRNAWGNQIWFDLLLAAGAAWTLIIPRAKAQRMRVFAWLGLILLTGSIGLLGALARLLFLEERAATRI